jgi:hypothetical protein
MVFETTPGQIVGIVLGALTLLGLVSVITLGFYVFRN